MRLKKVKGALEKILQSEYIISVPEIYRGKWNTVFLQNAPIHVEIGMGKGKFIIEMAEKHPEINFIGIEMYDSVLVKATEFLKNNEMKLNNLKLLLMDANHIEEVFEHEIDTLYLNFSDPWPKAKHTKRRLTSTPFLQKYDSIFRTQKRIVLKTDNLLFFDFSIESLKENGYNLIEVTNDLESLHDTTNVLTEYEAKFMEKGTKINRLIAIKNESGGEK